MPVTGPYAMAIAASLAVAACGSGGSGGSGESSGSAATPTATASATTGTDDGKIDCALDGSGTFAHTCEVERRTADGAKLLIVRHPDGAFRRFEIVTDGRGVIPADGAQSGTATIGEGVIELKVDNDRYRFPATIANAGG